MVCARQEEGAHADGGLFRTIAILTPLLFVAPQVFLTERFLPGWAPLHILCLPGFGPPGWHRGRGMPRAYALIHLAPVLSGLFVQLALGLAGWPVPYDREPSSPVPGMIPRGPAYRGGGLFMPICSASPYCWPGLRGAATCAIPVWDTVAASGRKAVPPPRWMSRLRLVFFGLMLAVPAVLRLSGAPTGVAVALGLALGLLLLPVAVLLSRRYGSACYCLAVCPLGLVANWLGKIAPWRIRRTDACMHCLACIRVCRYGALTPERLKEGRPGPGCTLCRDCLSVCRHGGLAVTLYGKTCGAAESSFVVLLSIMHTVFLVVARV
ncbi:MAG: 4Fe-4S ferredoxin [Bilophila wadsworthia]